MVAWSMIAWRRAARSPPVERSISVSAPYFCAHSSFSTSSAVPLVGRDDESPARHLVADELRPGALALRHPPHLPGDQALPGRFELCHIALPSAGITRVRFEGSAGSPCFLSRLERGGSPSVASCLRPYPEEASGQVSTAAARGRVGMPGLRGAPL